MGLTMTHNKIKQNYTIISYQVISTDDNKEATSLEENWKDEWEFSKLVS